MTFSEFVRKVELYLHVEGEEERSVIKDFINEAILDFARLYDWKRLVSTVTITLDGSGSYSISSLTDEYFVREISLIIPYANTIQLTTTSTAGTPNRTEFTKYEYRNYLRLESTEYAWALEGDTIYVPGEQGDLTFFFISVGENYPLSADADTAPVLTYYDDIIKRMAALKYMEYIGDDEAAVRENRIILSKMQMLKTSEKRGEHRGKFHHVKR